MRTTLDDVLAHVWVSLVSAVGVALAVLLPPLLATEGSSSAGTALVVLALTSLLPVGRCAVVASRRAGPVRPTSRVEAWPRPSEQATDPVHHPLRPRAPGLA
jgi:hypothetical protein